MTSRSKAPQKPPGELEQQVLLALAACRQEASGAEVYDGLMARTGRELSLPAIYLTLDRLRKKGWVTVRSQDPEPGRGGKPRKFYELSPAGAELLQRMREQFDRLWGAAAGHPLIDSAGGDL
jgi:DNA-binding PadR family transcriptional regulator